MVVLDEFDSIRLFPDARDFLNLLRELVYYPDRFPMAALAVARRPIDRIEVEAADISSFAGVCDSIYLRPMDYEQVRAMAARSPDLPATHRTWHGSTRRAIPSCPRWRSAACWSRA